VILNLLTNAKDTLEETIKTSKSDFEKTIVIRTYHDDHTNFIELKDNGNGIEPDVIDRIMLPFYTTKEAGKGTGLGLSISFGIIKELKGNIDVESDPLFGTTFKITLPVAEIK
jgi:signal transduction histidine kinase